MVIYLYEKSTSGPHFSKLGLAMSKETIWIYTFCYVALDEIPLLHLSYNVFFDLLLFLLTPTLNALNKVIMIKKVKIFFFPLLQYIIRFKKMKNITYKKIIFFKIEFHQTLTILFTYNCKFKC